MSWLQRLVRVLKRWPRLYTLGIVPFYFARFVWWSLRERSLWFYRYPPGHHGSTIPSGRELSARRSANVAPADGAGVELNIEAQLALLHTFSMLDPVVPLSRQAQPDRRYYSDNPSFRHPDARVLDRMLHALRPQRIIEIGSGFSSALMLDLRVGILAATHLTFIEPHPTTLNRLLRAGDRAHCTVIEQKVQEVVPAVFEDLAANDLLFVDSSHVLKVGSDLSTVFFDILPRLAEGVVVHFHDVWWPFEYPPALLAEGRNWNEIYFLRAFLQFNHAFELLLFPSYLEAEHRSALRAAIPDYGSESGASVWVRRKPAPARWDGSHCPVNS